MGFTTVPDKSDGDTFTETMWDTYIRDNHNSCASATVTAKGSIPVATAANTLGDFTVGNDDEIIVADSGEATGLDWQAVHACRVTDSDGHALGASAWTSIDFDTNDGTEDTYNLGSMHSAVANTSRITCQAGGDGIYHISGGVEFETSALTSGTTIYGLRILLNGATVIKQKVDTVSNTNPSLDWCKDISTEYSLAATDYVELQAYSSGGYDVNHTANYSPIFCATWQRRP